MRVSSFVIEARDTNDINDMRVSSFVLEARDTNDINNMHLETAARLL